MAGQLKSEFGALLASFRDERGWTQQEAADRIGVSRVQLARWEAGMHLPDVTRFDAIADAYDQDAEDLRIKAGIVASRRSDVSAWALGLARRIDRRAGNLPPGRRQMLERSIDTILALSEA